MTTYVRGEHDVLSNFFPCRLEYEGQIYNSAEHLYQSKKAIHHGFYALDRQIKRAHNASRAKQLSNSIKRIDRQWEENKAFIMSEILKIKFQQCECFRDRLMATKGYIAHNVPDEFWGTGRRGKGQNVFGLLLAALRLSVS